MTGRTLGSLRKLLCPSDWNGWARPSGLFPKDNTHELFWAPCPAGRLKEGAGTSAALCAYRSMSSHETSTTTCCKILVVVPGALTDR